MTSNCHYPIESSLRNLNSRILIITGLVTSPSAIKFRLVQNPWRCRNSTFIQISHLLLLVDDWALGDNYVVGARLQATVRAGCSTFHRYIFLRLTRILVLLWLLNCLTLSSSYATCTVRGMSLSGVTLRVTSSIIIYLKYSVLGSSKLLTSTILLDRATIACILCVHRILFACLMEIRHSTSWSRVLIRVIIFLDLFCNSRPSHESLIILVFLIVANLNYGSTGILFGKTSSIKILARW